MHGTIRYGVIGGGDMGREHIRNLALLDGATVAAVADPFEPSRSAALRIAGPNAVACPDYRELLADASIDAVVIATPNHTHAVVLEDALATDKAILVEKPLCTTVEDCRRMEAAARQGGNLVWVGMEYRYMPPVSRLVETVHAGAIGRLRMLHIREHRWPFLPKVGDWNRFAHNTGGTLVEKCCHFFDLMRLITRDEPVRVYASGAQDVNHLDERYCGAVPDLIDNAFVVVDFAGGGRALLDLCMFGEASPAEQEIVATGDAGRAACTIPASELTIGRRASGRSETTVIEVAPELLSAGSHHGSTWFEHEAFFAALRAGTPPAVSVRDGLVAVAMGVAAERSIAEGRPVDMAEIGLKEPSPQKYLREFSPFQKRDGGDTEPSPG